MPENKRKTECPKGKRKVKKVGKRVAGKASGGVPWLTEDSFCAALAKIGAGKRLLDYITQLYGVSDSVVSSWQILGRNLALAILHATLTRLRDCLNEGDLSLQEFKPLFHGLNLPAMPGSSLSNLPKYVSFEDSIHYRRPTLVNLVTPDAPACNLTLVALMEDYGGRKDSSVFNTLSHYRLDLNKSRLDDAKSVSLCVEGGFSVSLQHAVHDIAPLFAEKWYALDDTSIRDSSRFDIGTSVFILTHFVQYEANATHSDVGKHSGFKLGLLEVRLLRGKCLNERQARVVCTMRGLNADIPKGSLICMGNVSWERPSA